MAGFRSAKNENFGTQVPNDARCSRPERRAAFERGLPWAWQPSDQQNGHGFLWKRGNETIKKTYENVMKSDKHWWNLVKFAQKLIDVGEIYDEIR